MVLKNLTISEDLANCKDSMLFGSGTQIAYAEFTKGTAEITVSLEVRGKVRVIFGEYVYTNPKEFPNELKTLIRSDKYWDTNEKVYVSLNNWFEYIFTVKTPDGEFSDGVVCEDDISMFTTDRLELEMTKIAEYAEDVNNFVNLDSLHKLYRTTLAKTENSEPKFVMFVKSSHEPTVEELKNNKEFSTDMAETGYSFIKDITVFPEHKLEAYCNGDYPKIVSLD